MAAAFLASLAASLRAAQRGRDAKGSGGDRAGAEVLMMKGSVLMRG
jgi:hypothetical protein